MTLQEVDESCKTPAPKGFALLNAAFPGWINRIDLGRLDLADPSCCVLGQLYGNYTSGCNELFAAATAEEGAPSAAHEHGFIRFEDHSCSWCGSEADGYTYAELTAEWSALITAAREEAKTGAQETCR